MRRLLSQFSIFALFLGLFFAAASLTPSLIPRTPALQGILAGVVLALGYLCGRILDLLWRAADMPVPGPRLRAIVLAVAGVGLAALLAVSLRYTFVWQNDLRGRMQMEPLTGTHTLTVVLLALAVFILLWAVGAVIALVFRLVRAQLYKVMPARRANVFGVLLVALALFVVTRDGLLDATITFLDETREAAQALFETAPPAPGEARIPGGPGSLVDWAAMGQPGRDFVTLGPDAAAISAFTGKPALDPIRVYVGRANAETPEDRAQLALAELQRLGAFDREVLIVASPTGTGWMDPGSADPVEYMHGGDIATVSVQYSYLQSPLALVFETETGLRQATATLSVIHDHWKTLPADARPRIYAHGLSLGAWSSMYATTLFRLVEDPLSGAFWVGPPFPSQFWRSAQDARDPDTPWVQPQVGDGTLLRFAARADDGSEGAAPWGAMRIMFLQYPSDGIVFFEPNSFWRRPVWMAEPAGDGVSPYLRFMPIVTQFQLALDMAISTSAPAGYGHSYHAPDYIGPWVQVTDPADWTPQDTERLIAHCDNGFQNGCTNQ